MVDIEDIFKEYDRYERNPKEKNKKRLIIALMVLYKSAIKIIPCCSECDGYENRRDTNGQGPYCWDLMEYLDPEKVELVGYIHPDCPAYKKFDDYMNVIEKLKEPGQLLSSEKMDE